MADSLIKPLPGLWGRCEYHRVLVKAGTRCAACALLDDKGDAMGATGVQLRGEHFEIGEPQPGWSTEVGGDGTKA